MALDSFVQYHIRHKILPSAMYVLRFSKEIALFRANHSVFRAVQHNEHNTGVLICEIFRG